MGTGSIRQLGSSGYVAAVSAGSACYHPGMLDRPPPSGLRRVHTIASRTTIALLIVACSCGGDAKSSTIGTVAKTEPAIKTDATAGDAKADAGNDAKAEAGDAKAEAGDAKAEAGDAKAEAGDAKAEAGDAKAEAGDAKAEAGDATAKNDETKAE